ncbi:hypothetical protein FOZ63_013517, partial [Perkinsus olseni]
WGVVIIGSVEAYAGPKADCCIYRAPAPCRSVAQVMNDTITAIQKRPLDTRKTRRAQGVTPPQCCPFFDDSEKRFIYDVMRDMRNESWVPVPSTSGMYQARIRSVVGDDITDLPNQRFICEVMIPKIASTEKIRGRSYAVRMYERLSVEQKTIYHDLVQAYVDAKFWYPASSATSGPTVSLPGAQVFLLPGGSRKPRLVVDMRDINAHLPKASSNQPSLWLPVATMRALGGRTTVIGDARAAFYKVRLVSPDENPLVLTLETGIGTYTSSRLVFGIVVGPSGLSANLGRIVERARSCGCATKIILLPRGIAILIIFVDDFALSGEVEQ